MPRKIILVTGMLLHFIMAFNQETLSVLGVDTSTYQAYLSKNWKQVIAKGNAGLDAGIDFYYLRMRIGIAYFELKNYRKAIPHFQHALSLNPQERYANEFLYYAYQYSGRQLDAEKLRKKMHASVKTILFDKHLPFISSLQIHTLFSNNPESYNLQTFSVNNGQQTETVSQVITDGYYLVMPELSFRLAPAFHLTLAAGELNKKNYYFVRSLVSPPKLVSQEIDQSQVYIKTAFYLARGVTAWGSFHHLKLSVPLLYEGDEYGITPGLYSYTYDQSDEVYSAGLTIEAGKISVMPYANASTLNQKTQFIPGVQVTWYPLGNLNLYFSTTASFQLEYLNNVKENNRNVFTQEGGFKLLDHLWIEGYFRAGNVRNYSTPGAGIVYNDMNLNTGEFGLRLLIPFSKYKNKIYVGFQSGNYESHLNPEQNTGYSIPYTTYGLNAGASFSF